ncbi:MAG TPA: hypothetical protein VGM93_03495, partial [Acidimicrobiales bacterium]
GLAEGTWRGRVDLAGADISGAIGVSAVIAYGPLVTDLTVDQPNAWTSTGCVPVPTVTAKVFDESGVGHVSVLWTAPGNAPITVPMYASPTGWSVEIPPGGSVGIGQWHVEAYDRQGNMTASQAMDLPVSACASANE